MRAELLSWCRENALFSPGQRVICAVSGGADSMALLWCLWTLRQTLGIEVEAAHFDHRLRGAESERDARFVREFCEKHGIVLHFGAAATDAYAASGVEETARRLRYAFFDTLACDRIATAHNADDNAETVLLHLLRGTGLRGLCGIPPVRGRIVRPLLFAPRTEILEFLHAEGIEFVEDSTNAADDCLRNRLRHGVMPWLYAEAPALPAQLVRQTALLRSEDEFLDAQACALLVQEQENLWRCAPLQAAPAVLQRRALRVLLRAYYPADLALEHIEAVRGLLTAASPSAQVSLPQGLCARRVYDCLSVQPEVQPEAFYARLNFSGETRLDAQGIKILCTVTDFFEKTEKIPFQFAIKYDMIKNHTVVVRSRRPGDTILRGTHRASLKKLFIDRKIPKYLRGTLCVFESEGKILAVEGIGTASDCRPLAGEPALIIQIEKEEMHHATRHRARSDH